jgi:hypothetical protein
MLLWDLQEVGERRVAGITIQADFSFSKIA